MENFDSKCKSLELLLEERKTLKQFIEGMPSGTITVSYKVLNLNTSDSVTKELILKPEPIKALRKELLVELQLVEEGIKEYLGYDIE